MRAAVLSVVAAMFQFNSVQLLPEHQHASDEAWRALEGRIPPSAWTRDFTIEVSELDGLPAASSPEAPKDCLKKDDAGCSEVALRCRSRTSCEFIRLDPYLGHARRVTVQATTTLAMARGKPIADAMVNEPLGRGTLDRAYFDNVPANNLLADTKNPDWIQSASANDIEAYTPVRARDLSIAGAAVVECVIKASGALDACDPLAAHPSDLGFERAAVSIATTKYRVKADGYTPRPAAGTKVRLRIDFPASLEFHHINVVY